jgi:hypothetical protein
VLIRNVRESDTISNNARKLGGIIIRLWNDHYGILWIKTFTLLEMVLQNAFE